MSTISHMPYHIVLTDLLLIDHSFSENCTSPPFPNYSRIHLTGSRYCNFLLYNLNIHVEDEPPSNISLTHITGIPASTSLHDKHQLQAGAHIKEEVEDSGESSR